MQPERSPSLLTPPHPIWLLLLASAWALPALAQVKPMLPAAAAPTGTPGATPAKKGVEAQNTVAEPDQYEEVRTLMGVPCSVRVYHQDPDLARKAVQRAMVELGRVASKFDASDRTSEIAGINASAGSEEVLVSEETHLLLQDSLDLCRRTAGAYDLTVASFDYLWNFSSRPFVRPLPDEVAARRALAGCRQVAIKPSRAVRILQPGVRITLQDVIHGHAAQKTAQVLRAAGVENFRIRVGGDVYVQGRVAGTRHWFVSVPNPRQPDVTLMQLYLTSQCAATRSDSEHFVVKNGKRFHDVLDPRTGEPAQGVVQATVIAADPALADALSTAVFVLGPKAGLALLAREKNVEGFVVDKAGKVWASKGMPEFGRVPDSIQL